MEEPDPFVIVLQRWIAVLMQRSMRDFLTYAKERGYSMSQLGALFQIRRRGSSAVTDLGEYLGVTSSAASQMLERLVQQQLIQRSEDPTDRRVKQIVLTDKGIRVLQESVDARQSWLCDLANTLSESEKDTITAALNVLIDRVNRLRPPVESGN